MGEYDWTVWVIDSYTVIRQPLRQCNTARLPLNIVAVTHTSDQLRSTSHIFY